jgi:hypothetical protein
MRCARCGNEVSPNEAFCGQCGTPNTSSAQPTEMVSTPTPRSGLLHSYNPNVPLAPSRTNSYDSGMAPLNPTIPPFQYSPDQTADTYPSPTGPSSPQQSPGFHQAPTEAMSPLPSNAQNHPPGYQQSGFTGASISGGYAGQGLYSRQMQPFQTGNYPGPPYPQAPFVLGQDYEYGRRGRLSPPPPKQSNSLLIIICICIAVALIAVASLGTIYLLKSRPTPRIAHPQPTTAPTSVPTLAPTDTPTLEPSPTPSPTPLPSPTLAPTPTPDTDFQWCDQACTNNGFSVEYPKDWQLESAATATVIQFIDTAQPDAYAVFKTLGPVSGSANELINNDLQTNFAPQPGYIAPKQTSTTTISGETWATSVAYHDGKPGPDGTPTQERVEIFTIVHQGKGYIIELQAPDTQFDTVNTQSFENMLGRFQFLPATTP